MKRALPALLAASELAAPARAAGLGLAARCRGAALPTGESRLKLFVEPAVGLAVEKHALDPVVVEAFARPKIYCRELSHRPGVPPRSRTYDIGRHSGVFGAAVADVGVLCARTIFVGLHTGVQARFP